MKTAAPIQSFGRDPLILMHQTQPLLRSTMGLGFKPLTGALPPKTVSQLLPKSVAAPTLYDQTANQIELPPTPQEAYQQQMQNTQSHGFNFPMPEVLSTTPPATPPTKTETPAEPPAAPTAPPPEDVKLMEQHYNQAAQQAAKQTPEIDPKTKMLQDYRVARRRLLRELQQVSREELRLRKRKAYLQRLLGFNTKPTTSGYETPYPRMF